MISRSWPKPPKRKYDYDEIYRLSELGFKPLHIARFLGDEAIYESIIHIVRTVRNRKELERREDEQKKVKQISETAL